MDQAGNRVRRWLWPNLSPEPHVPLSPIFISLNRHVGVRILAQDKIFVSFLAMGRQAKFNMGTKAQVTASVLSHSPQWEGAARETPIWAYPMVDAPYAVPWSFPKKQAVEVCIFLPLLWRWGTCQPQLFARGHSGGLHSQAGPCLHPQGPPWLCYREESYDPCGQGAWQLLLHRLLSQGAGSPVPSSGGSAATCPLSCRSAPPASCPLQPSWVRMSSCCLRSA